MPYSKKPYFKKQTGASGEDLAAQYLKKSGYKIIAQNYRTKIGEIDILAQIKEKTPASSFLFFLKRRQSVIVVVEVKTKSGADFGEGFEMVNYFKQRKLLSLAKLIQAEYPDQTIRIDVISVDMSIKPPEIKHFENAVEEN